MQSLRVMLLVSSMHNGGAERVAASLCSAWAARGDAPTLVATWSQRGGCDYPLDPQVEFIHLADRVTAEGLTRFGYPGRLLALRRLVKRSRPDVVLSFLTNVNVSACLAMRGLGIPLIVSERLDPSADAECTRTWAALQRLVYPWADRVVVQTRAAIAPMHARVPRAAAIDVVPNPIPPALLEAQVPGRASAARRRVVAMGRLAPQKQFDQLIDAFAPLASRCADVDLFIWGEGSLRGELEAQVERRGLRGRVFLAGRTDAPWQELGAADLFVLSSAYEGFPNALLEAMALGVPSVSYDCPSGPRDLSEGGRSARLVRLNDKEALTAAIEDLLSDPAGAAALGRSGAESVRSRFGIEAVLSRWDRLFGAVRARAAAAAGAPA